MHKTNSRQGVFGVWLPTNKQKVSVEKKEGKILTVRYLVPGYI